MKRGFIRVLWGVYKDERHYRHRVGLDNHFKFLKLNQYEQPFIAYVFGEDNYKQLIDMGFDCRLVDKNPIVWDMKKEQFRHKLEALRLGVEDFDEFVFLDWDTQLIKPLPDNFWDVLNLKSPLQASLRQYRKRKVFWRKEDARKVPCAPFIYIGDKEIPKGIIKIWEDIGRPWSEETTLMKYMENLMGGWKGIEYYWNHFEPHFFNLEYKCAIYTPEQYAAKDICFKHFTPREIIKELRKTEMANDNDSSLTREECKMLRRARLLARKNRQLRREAKRKRREETLARRERKRLKKLEMARLKQEQQDRIAKRQMV